MSLISSFLRNKNGNVILIAALALPVIILIGGAAVTFSQRGAIRSELQKASDAAALAAMALPDGTANEQREAEARRYMRSNFPDNYRDTGFLNDKYVTVSASDERVTVGATLDIKNSFSFLGGPEYYNAQVGSSAVPNIKQVPAAVDLVIGLDGGCGNEKGGKFTSLREAHRNLLNQISSHQGQQVYAAGIWSADHPTFLANTQYDVGYMTGSLSHVANFVAGRPDTADNGSNTANVILEMYNALAASHGDTRDPKILAKKKRIGIIFQGSHNGTAGEAATYGQCNSLVGSLDAVYAFASAGIQNTGGDCSNKHGDNIFPNAPPAIRVCSKPLVDAENPNFPRIDGYQAIAAGSLPYSMNDLANGIANLKTSIRSGVRLEQ